MSAAKVPLRGFTEKLRALGSTKTSYHPALEKVYTETFAAAGKLQSKSAVKKGEGGSRAGSISNVPPSSNTSSSNAKTISLQQSDDKMLTRSVHSDHSISAQGSSTPSSTWTPSSVPLSSSPLSSAGGQQPSSSSSISVVTSAANAASKFVGNTPPPSPSSVELKKKGVAQKVLDTMKLVARGDGSAATMVPSSSFSSPGVPHSFNNLRPRTHPEKKVLGEVASLKNALSQGIPSPRSPLAGVVLGASDCFNVAGLRTTNGVKATMLHHVPEIDDAIISILRDAGAKFSGKIHSQFPLSYLECTHYKNCPAAVAIEQGACHAALVSSLGGPGGLISAAHHGMYGFLPTLGALPTKPIQKKVATSNNRLGGDGVEKVDGIRQRSHLRDVKYHPTFVAPNPEDLEYIWESLVEGKITSKSVEAEKEAKRLDEEEEEIRELEDQQQARSQSAISSAISGMKNSLQDKDDEEDYEDQVALQIGVPSQLFDEMSKSSAIEDCTKEWTKNCVEWVDRLKARAHTKNRMNLGHKGGQKIAFEDVEISLRQLEDSFKHSVTVTQYELARNLMATMELEGEMMDEMPQRLIPAIFAGRKISDEQYTEAKEAISELRVEVDEDLNDVDVIALPLLAPPFNSGHFRTAMFSLPFSTCGFPMVSIPGTSSCGTHEIGPIQFVGELGADRGLLEDVLTFQNMMA